MGNITEGTKEWADSNVNIYSGCSNNCRYCYAKKMAIRFGRKTGDNWKEMILNENSFKKGYKKRNGRIMFPTSHDITPKTIENCLEVIGRIIRAGNLILITTKPNLMCIKEICYNGWDFKDVIQFRFTITSFYNKKLKHWEPGAPNFEERKQSLIHAFSKGFKTSLSIEPCLDHDPRYLIKRLRDYVTESIWLGPMNYCGNHDFNSKETLQNWVKWFKDDKLVRLKDSVYNKLGISK